MAAGGEDRLSLLPDDLLLLILGFLPLRHAIRTSALSRRWHPLWLLRLASSTAVDFDDHFSHSQPPAQLAGTIARYLHIHGSRPLRRFALCFSPTPRFAGLVVDWVRAAVAKGVQELELDLSGGFPIEMKYSLANDAGLVEQPGDVFHRSLLTSLSLTKIDWPHLSVRGLSGLRSLSLDRIYSPRSYELQWLSGCPLLESLTLKRIFLDHETLALPSLRTLALVECAGFMDLQLLAPNLERLVYCGVCGFMMDLSSMPAVSDAYIYIFDVCHFNELACNRSVFVIEHLKMLSTVRHFKILTLCSKGLSLSVYNDGYDKEETVAGFQAKLTVIPFEMPNLQELQLLMKTFSQEHIQHIFRFFHRFSAPCLVRLFIQLPENLRSDAAIATDARREDDLWDISFHHLKLIKIHNFWVSRCELMVVGLLLCKAVVLEALVLVAPANSDNHNGYPYGFAKQLSKLPKASSQAQIVLCGFDKGEEGAKPTHQTYYHKERHSINDLSRI